MRFHEWVVVGLFCVFFFFYGLAVFGLVGADETRYAQIAREMLARHDWVSPTLYGRVWLEKPVLYYWSAMLSYRIFGVSDWSARLPVAVFATWMVAGIHIFVRRFRPGGQLHAALIACSSAATLAFARSGSTDMPLAACFTVGLLAWLAWFKTQEKKWLLAFYLFMAGGMLAKGPVAPLLAGLIILCFALLCKDARLVLQTLWLPGILLFILAAMPWYVLVQLRNPQFFTEFILRQNLARFRTNLYHHEQPFWYYLPVMLLGLLPWTVFSITAWSKTVRAFFRKSAVPKGDDTADDLEKFLAIWAVVPIFFFSFSQSKLPGYILPAVPAWVLLTVLYFEYRVVAQGRSYALWIAHALVVAAVTAVAFLGPQILLHPHAMPAASASIVPITAGVIFALAIIALAFWRGWQMIFISTAFVTVIAAGVLLKTTGPVIDAMQSARPAARHLANSNLPVVVFHVPRGIQYGLGFYFNREIPSYDAGNFPQQDHFLLTKKDEFKELIQMMRERAQQEPGMHPACSRGSWQSKLEPETSFRSPVLDLYRVSAWSCSIAPITDGAY
ncbi:MAG TPA: glycosyltransferase family 39 protein [Terriglobales bacterium]|nr:glycosyltransferase family 39 protein [Terriglobales bacterium]